MLTTLTISTNQVIETRYALQQRRSFLSELRSSDDVKIALQIEMIADIDTVLALLDIPRTHKLGICSECGTCSECGGCDLSCVCDDTDSSNCDRSEHCIKIGDRVSFDGDEGQQTGTISDLRRDVSNGELHAWVELEHQKPGIFKAVPLGAIVPIIPDLHDLDLFELHSINPYISQAAFEPRVETIAIPDVNAAYELKFAIDNRVKFLQSMVDASPTSYLFAKALADAKRMQSSINLAAPWIGRDELETMLHSKNGRVA